MAVIQIQTRKRRLVFVWQRPEDDDDELEYVSLGGEFEVAEVEDEVDPVEEDRAFGFRPQRAA